MNLKGKRFVVTGGASLVGSHVAEQLLQADAERVTLIDNFSLSSPASIEGLAGDERVRVVRGDVLRLDQLLAAFEDDTDGVFHVAALLTLPLSRDPALGIDVNAQGTRNVLEACRWRGVPKVVLSSSVTVYGNATEGLVTEDHPFVAAGLQPPAAIYGASKVMAENLCRLYAERHGIEFVALRYSSIYGERQHGRGVNTLFFNDVYESARHGEPAMVSMEPTEVHDYVYVGDVARANLLAMQADISGESLTIVSGEATTAEDATRAILGACGSDLEPRFEVPDESVRFTASSTLTYSRAKAAEVLGWEPLVGLEEGVARLVTWLDEKDGATGAREALAVKQPDGDERMTKTC